MKLLARRLSDGSVLHLLRQWLDAPIVEEERDGRRRVLPNRQGVPQGGVISPLLANLYLNALDWAVNDPAQSGHPALVRPGNAGCVLLGDEHGERFQGDARMDRPWRTFSTSPAATRFSFVGTQAADAAVTSEGSDDQSMGKKDGGRSR